MDLLVLQKILNLAEAERAMDFQALALVLMVFGSSQQVDPDVLPDVAVTAPPRSAAAARQYVDRIAGAPLNAISLATWRTSICVETANLRPDVAEIIIAQIAARSARVGVETKTTSCKPNVSLIGTSQGPQTAAALAEAYPRAFKASSAETQGDRADLRRFVERDAPVRWWTIAAQYDTDLRMFAEPLWSSEAVRRETGASSMFNQNLVRAMVQTIVIIDASRTAPATAEAVGDYLAMVVLAEINPDASFESDQTVLRLWEPESGVAGMTIWDQRYLQALYCARAPQPGNGAPIRSRYQLADISRRMVELTNDEPPRADGSCD